MEERLLSHRHLHLHVLSADMCSPAMKLKKHYNSFHPSHGFFLSLEEVRGWLDAEPSYFETVKAYSHSLNLNLLLINRLL